MIDYRGIEPLVLNPKSNYPSKTLFASPLVDSAYGVTKLNLVVKYSFQQPPAQDVKVVFTKDDALANLYNSSLFIKYLPLPADGYELTAQQVIIPAGSQSVTLPVKIIPGKISGPNKYIIAFSLVSADGVKIAQNSKNMIYTLKGQ